jgi:hypothetical protein
MASIGQCGMDFATTTMGTAALRRLSNAADKEMRARLSAQFELGPISALPVKRLSQELAAVLKSRDSWSASVSPLPPSMQNSHTSQLEARSGDAASCSPKCEAVANAAATQVRKNACNSYESPPGCTSSAFWAPIVLTSGSSCLQIALRFMSSLTRAGHHTDSCFPRTISPTHMEGVVLFRWSVPFCCTITFSLMLLLLWREQEPATVQSHFQQQQHQPWYSLLSCRLLSFIGGGGPTALNGEEYTTAKAVVSSHRLSFDHRLSHDHRLSQEQRVSLSSTRCESPPPS